MLPPPPASAQSYANDVRARYGDLAADYLRLYPPRDLEQTQLAATRDVVFGWAAERLVRKQAAIGQNSFLYFFDHDYPSAAAADLTAFHASEVPFVFGTFENVPAGWPAIPDTPGERQLAGAMLDYWTSFARNGRPSAAHGPAWESVSPSGSYMTFGDAPRLSTHFMPGMYELHEQIMCRRREAGTQSWNWRAGSGAPVLSGPTALCSTNPG